MSPMLRVLLCLGLCLDWRIKAQNCSDLTPGLLSKPSLWAKPGALIPKGKLVTCWCQGSSEALGYRLEKEGTHWSETSYCNGSKASFSLGEMKTETSGRYLCQYWTSSGCSDFSDPLMLIMTGQHDKPVLSAKPSSVVVPGENVTLHCNSSYDVDGFMMSKDQVDEMTPPRPWTIQAKFSIWAVKATDGGTYRCYSFYSNSFYEWSVPSDPLVLRVTETPEDHSLSVPREPDSTSLTTSPKHSDQIFGLPRLTASILMGILALIILLLFILPFLLLRRRCSQQHSRIKSRDKEAEIKETLRRCSCEGRQTEEARQEDAVAFKREDPQEVTYVQLNLKCLKSGAKPPSPSVPVEPTVYATFT